MFGAIISPVSLFRLLYHGFTDFANYEKSLTGVRVKDIYP
jgi:hypothetical protein